jgi:hypothetical protein
MSASTSTSFGLCHRKPDDECQHQSGQANDQKCLAPADILGATRQVGDHDSRRNAHGEHAHGGRSFFGRVVIGNHRVRRWAAAGFADANPYASERQLQHIGCNAGQGRHRTPYGERKGDQVAPVKAVSEQSNRHAECCVEKREGRTRKKTENPVIDHEFCFDGRQQDGKYLAVDEIKGIDDDQHCECITARRLAEHRSRLSIHCIRAEPL